MEKRRFELDGRWAFKEFPESARRMRDLDAGSWLEATVPGSIYTDLVAAGNFSRFDLDAHPEDFDWVSERPWVYRKQFELDAAFCRSTVVDLVFDGLDTVTHIWLNDKLLGKTDNMFTPHRFSVGSQLRCGRNTLIVKFLSATRHAKRLMQRYGALSDFHFGDPCRSYVRKAQYQFGSVLGPSLPGCGIFRSVRLEAFNTARLDDLNIRTIDCNEHYADIRVGATLKRKENDDTPVVLRLAIDGGGLDVQQTLVFRSGETQNTTVIRIERPIFWQPVGYGVPHLYQLTATLATESGDILDSARHRFGVRHLRLLRVDDDAGQSFCFEVNDRPIFIKGANWTPLSMFPGTHTEADYERLLTRLKDAHVTMLRVWGGGYYEDDVFYRLCDKLGILVWQDFMFASAYYPDRQWFLDIVEREAQAVVQRLRNYACVALWCGNSRIDHLHESGRLGRGRKFYGRGIYHALLPTLLEALDPDREYLPTTPFSADDAKDLNAPNEGTHHAWEVWNGFAATREYLFDDPQMPRFLCEFGLQSLPSMDTLERVCRAGRLACGSAALEKHDYQIDGAVRMARYCAELFAPPHALADYIEQTQLAQARGIKLCVEHLRANSAVNSGLLLWTANDCAPSAGFSMIDFTGRPKAVYHYARRFFAPLLVTLELEKSSWLRPYLKGKGVVVVNDTPLPLTATVRCRCMDFYGRALDGMDYPVAIGPFAKSPPRVLPRALACPLTPNRCFLHLEVIGEKGVLAENSFFYLPDKHLDWPTAKVEMAISSPEPNLRDVWLSSSTVLRDVAVAPPAAAELDDNYVTLLPERSRRIRMRFIDDVPHRFLPIRLRSIPCGM